MPKKEEKEKEESVKKGVIIFLSIIGIIIILSILISKIDINQSTQTTDSQSSAGSGNYDNLAMCLTANGVVMYGAEWCPHCQNQKKAFGSSVQYINFVDCEVYTSECTNAGITGYPTWVINGEQYPGERELSQLAALSGCDLS